MHIIRLGDLSAQGRGICQQLWFRGDSCKSCPPWPTRGPLETLPGSLQLQGRTKSGFSSKAVGAA